MLVPTLSQDASTQWREPQEPSGSTREPRTAARPQIELPPLEGPVDPARYLLGPGDELELALFGRVTARVTIAVNAEGSIYVPNLGHVPVAGLTLVEARTRLSEEFDRRYRGVRADFTLLRPRRILVHVAGEVQKPGLVELQAPARVSEAVKTAGGFTSRASRRNLTVQRVRGSVEGADLERYATLGLPAENPYLDNGDVVRVPASTLTIELHGEVTRPGLFEFRPGDRLSGILALAGGARAGADSESVEVWRFSSATTALPRVLPLRAALEAPGGSSDPPLEPDDRIFVRNVANWHERATVQVRGEAIRPGVYAIPPQGQLASELISRFGGFAAYADINSATVFRPSLLPTRDTSFVKALRSGAREVSAEDAQFLKAHALAHGNLSTRLRRLAAGGDPSADFQILDGDLVIIPSRTGSVAVYGAVRRPGAVAFRQGAALEEYIRAVGGYGKRADRGRVRVTQAATGQPVRVADAGSIEDGDIVWVPEREPVSFFKSLASGVGFLAQVATVYLVIDQATR